jgi:hypothetical protein
VKFHDVQMIDFAGTEMVLKVDGQVYRVDLPSVSARLANAEEAGRRSFSISPSGYGAHWPHIDEDLTIDGLITSGHAVAPKPDEAPLALKEQPAQSVSSLRQHIQRVIDHVRQSHSKFSEVTGDDLGTTPIPFFGDIEKAEILTVGVNPSTSEFKENRNWKKTNVTAEYLEARLRNYFRLSDPRFHHWFSPWEDSLKILNDHSYANRAAHLDFSPRATSTIPTDEPSRESFLEMVRSDLPLFFETILLCRSAKVLLLAGSVTKRYYMNEFLKEEAPRWGFELQGDFQRQPGGNMHWRHELVSKTGALRMPVFFFSRGPAHPKILPQLVSKRRGEICDCLNNL